MRVIQIRNVYHEKQVTGTLLVVDDKGRVMFSSVCIEPPWKDNQRRISCVPADTYDLVWEYSPKFNRYLWELKGVPNRSEAKYHVANYVRQLEGCVAPGDTLLDIDGDGLVDVTNSADTLDKFHEALKGLTRTTVTIYGKH